MVLSSSGTLGVCVEQLAWRTIRLEPAAGLSHLAETDVLGRASHAAGVTPQHLRRCFQNELAETPSRWLWRLRVERALGMLLYSGMSLTEISERCGFASVYHFSRVFKRHHGSPPGKYRQDHWMPRG